MKIGKSDETIKNEQRLAKIQEIKERAESRKAKINIGDKDILEALDDIREQNEIIIANQLEILNKLR